MNYTILQGDNRDTLKTIATNSIDAVVTDPPYLIDFLGKAWDSSTYDMTDTFRECLRVLKPGGHILAFSAARTYHKMAQMIESAGFEIRDQIMWIYSSGFPKSQDVGKSIDRSAGKKNNLKRHDSKKKNNNSLDMGSGVRCPKCKKDSAARYSCLKGQECGMVYKPETEQALQWSGWGTALKPAHEPICLARKPIKTSIAQNVQRWGVGALNIDATRVPYENEADIQTYLNNKAGPAERGTGKAGEKINMFEKSVGYKNIKKTITREEDLPEAGRFPSNVIGEIPEYQKFFYCPKVSRKERHIGHEMPPAMFGDKQGAYDDNGERYAVGLDARKGNVGNNHPTVKPVALMEYLIRLITPPGGHVLDPFNGSGSTGMAAVGLGYTYTGCELDPNYVEISKRRIEAWLTKDENYADNKFDDLFE